MKFTLTYDGSLPSSGSKPKNEAKSSIRKNLHPQFVDLWKSHPALRAVEENRHFPKTGGAQLKQVHHQFPGPIFPDSFRHFQSGTLAPVSGNRGLIDVLDLCEPIHKHGSYFRPLVRETYALHCGLKITFLRNEPPGKIYQGGDIDGRIKTLLDALTMPQHVEQILEPASDSASPLYCLMEDDSLLSGLRIESERLLGGGQVPKDWVRLIIEVDVRVRHATIYNQSFLG
jgi:hypothetical protein